LLKGNTNLKAVYWKNSLLEKQFIGKTVYWKNSLLEKQFIDLELVGRDRVPILGSLPAI